MGEARVIRADRLQTRREFIDLEAMLPCDHCARIVWSFVETLDLAELYDAIKSREGEAGRPATDPAVLLALWLYATVEGVGSARELDRLSERDLAYRWLAGGVPLNYHGLADFRVAHVALLDRLLTESVTALVAEGLVSLAEIAVDGTKVRANASRKSFKTETRLMQIEAEVEARLAALKAEIDGAPDASARRRRAARERAAREVKERVAKTRKALEQIKAEKKERAKRHAKDEAKKSEAKASLSDAEARIMRFPDGAIRPAYNAQVAAALRNRKSKRRREPDSVKEWRSRMASAAGQAIYKFRKLIERLNAHCKNHGFGFMTVRGLVKCTAVALLHALANNLMAAHRLRAESA